MISEKKFQKTLDQHSGANLEPHFVAKFCCNFLAFSYFFHLFSTKTLKRHICYSTVTCKVTEVSKGGNQTTSNCYNQINFYSYHDNLIGMPDLITTSYKLTINMSNYLQEQTQYHVDYTYNTVFDCSYQRNVHHNGPIHVQKNLTKKHQNKSSNYS